MGDSPMDISSDVIAAATTLAGLILVFLGSNLAAYAELIIQISNQRCKRIIA